MSGRNLLQKMQNSPSEGLLNDETDSLAEIMKEKSIEQYFQRQNTKEKCFMNGKTIDNKVQHVDIDKGIRNEIIDKSLNIMDVDDNESMVLNNDNTKELTHDLKLEDGNYNEMTHNSESDKFDCKGISHNSESDKFDNNEMSHNSESDKFDCEGMSHNSESGVGESNGMNHNLEPNAEKVTDLIQNLISNDRKDSNACENMEIDNEEFGEMTRNSESGKRNEQETECLKTSNEKNVESVENLESSDVKSKEITQNLESFDEKIQQITQNEEVNGILDANNDKCTKQFKKINSSTEIPKSVQKLSKKIDSVIVKLKGNKQGIENAERENDEQDKRDKNMNTISKNSSETTDNYVNGCLKVAPKPIATIVIDSDTEMEDRNENNGPVMDLTVKHKNGDDLNSKFVDKHHSNVVSVIKNISHVSKTDNETFSHRNVDERTEIDEFANRVDIREIDSNLHDTSSSRNSDSIVNKKVSIMGTTQNKRKSTRPMRDLTSYFKKLPADVKTTVDEVECKPVQKVVEKPLPSHSSNRLFPIFPSKQKSNEKSGKMVEIANTVMQNLAACGTQISFSSGKTPETTRTSQSSSTSSHKPDLSIFLKGSDVSDAETPQDLSVNKKKTSPTTIGHDFSLRKTADVSSSKEKVQTKSLLSLNTKNEIPKVKTETVSSPTDVLKLSTALDSQLTEDNTVIEVPSFYSAFVIQAPPAENLKNCLEQLKKTIDEGTSTSVNNVVIEDEEAISTKRIVEEISKENPNDKYKEYFQSTLGKFFVEIGFNLVQEYVQKDLLQNQSRKRTKMLQSDLVSLEKSYEVTRKRNAAFKWQSKKCDYCDYTSESDMVIRKHLETPHLVKSNYCCNFCPFQTSGRSMNDIHHHMIKEHGITSTYEKQSNMECQNCEFSCKTKKSLEKHVAFCAVNFKEATNLSPDSYWEPPVKLTKVLSQPSLLNTTIPSDSNKTHSKADVSSSGLLQRLGNTSHSDFNSTPPQGTTRTKSGTLKPRSVSRAAKKSNSFDSNVLLAAQISQLMGSLYDEKDPKKISETIQKLQILEALTKASSMAVPDVVTCEICDGYLNGKTELRNHLMMMHHVKIHPRMLNQKPNLSCEKCEHRFYTDQGLERHLLGKHGLVSKMLQNAACTGQDAGRCPLCGKYLAGGLLAHVSDVHQTVLRPAFLSYKCTVCTATFPAYSLFETHVYSEHKTVLPS